jgi:hypothetical protein
MLPTFLNNFWNASQKSEMALYELQTDVYTYLQLGLDISPYNCNYVI